MWGSQVLTAIRPSTPFLAPQGLVTVLNRTGCSDPDFQVHLNCLLLECLGDGQEWQKGVRQANDAFKSLKNTLHLPLWEYKVPPPRPAATRHAMPCRPQASRVSPPPFTRIRGIGTSTMGRRLVPVRLR